MRTSHLLALGFTCLLPLTSSAHESFLTPHIHTHAGHSHAGHSHGHDHGHDHDGHQHGSPQRSASKKAVVTEPEHEHEHEQELRLHATTGVRYTEYDTHEGDANLWETGLGLALDVNSWLQLKADARYGWFESDFADDEGWLPPSVSIEAHFPVGEHWEVGAGFRTQFPGEEPLGSDEWELSPEIEVRYDRGTWYASVLGEVTWVLYGSDHNHDHHEGGHEEDHHSHEEEGHDHDHDHDHDHHADEHAGHVDIHEIIEPHGDTEVTWQAAIGARLLDERLTLEGRIKGYHVIQGEMEDDHMLRAGLRGIYGITDNLTIIGDTSIPITDARRNEWQASVALRVSF